MTTLLTMQPLHLMSTVIVQPEGRLSEPKNSATIANPVPQDRLLALQPAYALYQPKKWFLNANAMSKTIILEEHVSDVKKAILEPTLMVHLVKEEAAT